MSVCLIFHCLLFEHYLQHSSTWVLAFAFSLFVASLIEIELFSNLQFSPTYGCFTKKECDFQTQHKIPHLGWSYDYFIFLPFFARERAASTMGDFY